MTTPQLHRTASTTASSYVFRLLGRGRARARRAPGNALGETLTALREEGRSALIEVEPGSGSLGRLLVQVGRVVFAQHQNSSSAQALAEIQQGSSDARLYTLELSDEQIIFACAALAGIPLALGETLGAGPEHVPALLTQLSQGSFTGVLALEQGLETLIWRFQRGRALNPVQLPERRRPGRLTQIVWQEQLLHEVNGVAPGSEPRAAVQPAPERTAATRTVVLSRPVLSRPVQNRPVQNRPVQDPAAPHTRSGTGQPQRDTEVVWARFRSVLRTQLGGRTEGIGGLIYSELGGFSGAELIIRLTTQVERIAGSAAARTFRDSF